MSLADLAGVAADYSMILQGSGFTKFNFMVMNAIKVHQARNL